MLLIHALLDFKPIYWTLHTSEERKKESQQIILNFWQIKVLTANKYTIKNISETIFKNAM